MGRARTLIGENQNGIYVGKSFTHGHGPTIIRMLNEEIWINEEDITIYWEEEEDAAKRWKLERKRKGDVACLLESDVVDHHIHIFPHSGTIITQDLNIKHVSAHLSQISNESTACEIKYFLMGQR